MFLKTMTFNQFVYLPQRLVLLNCKMLIVKTPFIIFLKYLIIGPTVQGHANPGLMFGGMSSNPIQLLKNYNIHMITYK